MTFGLGSKNTTGKIGRPAKPGETVDRRGIPVTNPKPGTRVVGSKPRQPGK
jgi:hypothetical protein